MDKPSENDHNMSAAHVGRAPDSTQTFRFLHLPAEIRLSTYHSLFDDAKIELDYMKIHSTTFNMIGTLKQVRKKRAALALTSKGILNESLPTLAQHTLVIIHDPWPSQDRQDMPAKLSQEFMRYIGTIRLSQEHFIRANRSLMPNLKTVILANCVDNFHCGCMSTSHVYQDFLEYALDWRWKRKQFLHLAEEAFYKFEFILYVKRPDLNRRREWHFDLATEELVHKSLVRGSDDLAYHMLHSSYIEADTYDSDGSLIEW